MQTSPHTNGYYYCSSQGIFIANPPPKMQSILPYIANQCWRLHIYLPLLPSWFSEFSYFKALNMLRILCLSVFFCFFQMSSLFAPTIPRWFFETHRHSSLCYCLGALAPPSSFDGWVSLTHISGFEHMRACVSSSQRPPSTSRSLYDSLCVVITDFDLSRPVAACLSRSSPYHLICLIFAPYPLLSLFSSRLLCSPLCLLSSPGLVCHLHCLSRTLLVLTAELITPLAYL